MNPPAAPAPSGTERWYTLAPAELFEELHSRASGLSSEEAAARLAEHGPNQLSEARRPGFPAQLWEQFNNFIVILLIVASILSAFLGQWVDASAIVAIVLLNAVLGIVQEHRAEEALAALRQLSAPEAHVLRDQKRVTLPGRELVPGDVVFLETGNHVPGDLRLLEAVNLQVNEAALTGESLPVQKSVRIQLEADAPLGEHWNTAYLGTTVTYGRGQGVVVETGMATQLGLIARLLETVKQEDTPLQKRLDTLGKTLGWGSLAICALVFAVAVFENTNLALLTTPGAGLLVYLQSARTQILNFFIVAVSLAIAAVPEGLPAVVTISLALGMREMVRRHVLIRRLASVETLGSATVICSDKTGTLTQNEMTVTRLWVDGQFIQVTGSGYSRQGEFLLGSRPIELHRYPGVETALWVGALNNDALLEAVEGDELSFRIVGDPTEGALLIAAAKADTSRQELHQAYPRQDEVPFDSERRRMVTIHDVREPRSKDVSPFQEGEKRGWNVIAVKGAPDSLLELSTAYQTVDDQTRPLDAASRQRILEANEAMTGDALRVLGLAYRVVEEAPRAVSVPVEMLEQELTFVGLVGMIDPPRAEVRAAIEKAGRAGIRTVMVTGDFASTARAVATSIGLLKPGQRVLTGSDVDRMSDDLLKGSINEVDVFARVSPEHKLRIVDALQANGEVVAMTGDGVNDAPAIRRADIGVAMGVSGTDVAKETADMVLTDDNYVSIVAAVEQGRVIYSNIRKFVYYLLSCNVAEILSIFLGTLITRSSPLTAIQLLWLNLVTDGAPALALGTEKGDPDIMSQPPRPPKEPIINRFMQVGILIQTIAITAVTLGAYFIGLKWYPGSIQEAQTMAFVTLSASELLRAYTSRSERYPLFRIGPFSNRNMNLAFLSSLALLLAVVYLPGLNTVFSTTPLQLRPWELMLPLLLLPSIIAELVKVYVSRGSGSQERKEPGRV